MADRTDKPEPATDGREDLLRQIKAERERADRFETDYGNVVKEPQGGSPETEEPEKWVPKCSVCNDTRSIKHAPSHPDWVISAEPCPRCAGKEPRP